MKQTKTPSSEAQKENLDKLVEELGPDVVKAFHRAYTLTAAAVYKRAVEAAEAQLQRKRPVSAVLSNRRHRVRMDIVR